jgi:hypothetical protein
MSAGANPIEALRAMLDAGAAIVGGVLDDPLLVRWFEAYSAMPEDDRQVVVDAVQREVTRRRLGVGVAATVGQTMHPNPNSALYVRAHGREVQPQQLQRSQMVVGMLRALRVMHLVAETPAIHEDWVAATGEALAQVDVATHDVVAGMLREMLQLIERLTTDRA